MQVAGLFAGVGGIELGLAASGHESVLMSELMPSAQAVLRDRFPAVPITPDVRDLRSLPSDVELLAAGFPCQNLSQAGLATGISGSQSGLVNEVFRILRRRYPRWLLIENVQFMLQLGRGEAMRHIISELEDMKMRWAYRVVDSRFSGVAQRRRRVILLASRTEDPREVLFADDAGDRPDTDYAEGSYGFYWTEGLRGLGWAKDAVPTLKGGSTIGIPSAPAIWVPTATPGRKFVLPSIEDGEALQGFSRGWTDAVEGARGVGSRWKLVGNAVTVGVAEWVGERLESPGVPLGDDVPLVRTGSWPTAAWGEYGSARQVVGLSEFPVHRRYRHLLDTVDKRSAPALSHRGAAGFLSRTTRAKLRFNAQFLLDMAEHIEVTRKVPDLAQVG